MSFSLLFSIFIFALRLGFIRFCHFVRQGSRKRVIEKQENSARMKHCGNILTSANCTREPFVGEGFAWPVIYRSLCHRSRMIVYHNYHAANIRNCHESGSQKWPSMSFVCLLAFTSCYSFRILWLKPFKHVDSVSNPIYP